MQKSPSVNVLSSVVMKASRAWSRDIGEIEGLQASPNGVENFVKASKRKTLEILIKELSQSRPNWNIFIRDKLVKEGDSEYNCIVDPLNGELNFSHGYGHCSISIGLQNNQECVIGIIYDPIRDEMFWAEKGQGAYMNHNRLRVSSQSNLNDSLLALKDETYKFFLNKNKDYSANDSSKSVEYSGIRNLGSVALDLAYVAAGRFDGMYRLGLKLHEIVAGLVIVKEAGGIIKDISRNHGDSTIAYDVIASNFTLANSLTKVSKKV